METETKFMYYTSALTFKKSIFVHMSTWNIVEYWWYFISWFFVYSLTFQMS